VATIDWEVLKYSEVTLLEFPDPVEICCISTDDEDKEGVSPSVVVDKGSIDESTKLMPFSVGFSVAWDSDIERLSDPIADERKVEKILFAVIIDVLGTFVDEVDIANERVLIEECKGLASGVEVELAYADVVMGEVLKGR